MVNKDKQRRSKNNTVKISLKGKKVTLMTLELGERIFYNDLNYCGESQDNEVCIVVHSEQKSNKKNHDSFKIKVKLRMQIFKTESSKGKDTNPQFGTD